MKIKQGFRAIHEKQMRELGFWGRFFFSRIGTEWSLCLFPKTPSSYFLICLKSEDHECSKKLFVCVLWRVFFSWIGTKTSKSPIMTRSPFSQNLLLDTANICLKVDNHRKCSKPRCIYLCRRFSWTWNQPSFIGLTPEQPILPSYRNHSVGLVCKSVDWFLYECRSLKD